MEWEYSEIIIMYEKLLIFVKIKYNYEIVSLYEYMDKMVYLILKRCG